jgi:hypothetical protein
LPQGLTRPVSRKAAPRRSLDIIGISLREVAALVCSQLSLCLKIEPAFTPRGKGNNILQELLYFAGVLFFASRLKEEEVLKKYLIAGAFVVASTLVAQTASAADYYVVRDATTKKCTIVDSKPTTTTTTVVDNGTFKTKSEAETGMKTMKVCTEQ